MHIVVLERTAKGDPEAYYYGSMAQAVGTVEPRTALMSVWGGIWNPETSRFDLEDISSQFIEAWEAAAKVRCEDKYNDADPDTLSDFKTLERFLDHNLEEPPFIVAPVTSVRSFNERFALAAE